jgi:opacity protein-like surface antigen
MKSILITALLVIVAMASAKAQSKPDTTYTLTESQIKVVYNLLQAGDNAMGNSDKVSTREWRDFHIAAVKIDSVLTAQYMKFHPQVKKKP